MEDFEEKIIRCLEAIEDATLSDKYEFSDPYTIGGATGAYFIKSPFNTECDWAVVSALGVGTFGFVAPTLSTEETYQDFNVPATASAITLVTGAGELLAVTVTATGSTNLTFQDGAGAIIGEVLSTATVGQQILMNSTFATSLVANKATTTPVVTASVLVAGTNATAGTLASNATFVIGSKNPNQTTLSSTGANTFGSVATSSSDSNNALPSFAGALTAQAPLVTYDASNFIPLGTPPYIYLQTSTPATTEVLVTVQFRRLLARYIPDIPRGKPHTHSHVQSRAPLRRLPAQSTMVAGYESQYPEAGGEPYGHRPMIEQDTGIMRKGVFPLGPTPSRKIGKHGR